MSDPATEAPSDPTVTTTDPGVVSPPASQDEAQTVLAAVGEALQHFRTAVIDPIVDEVKSLVARVSDLETNPPTTTTSGSIDQAAATAELEGDEGDPPVFTDAAGNVTK